MKLIRTLCCITLAALSALALAGEVRQRSPFDYELITYLWVLGVSAFGGVVSFVQKMREGSARAFNVTEFIGEIVTSGFAGLLTFWLAEAAELDRLYSAVMIAVSGHMGSRAIYLFEKLVQARVMAGMEAQLPPKGQA